jgi:predicted dehydrogenase
VRLVSGTPMNPIRAAIVGAGLMGRWHAHAAQRAGGHLVGIVDIDESAAVRLSKRFQDAALFTTIE